jgi:hypothetical protein
LAVVFKGSGADIAVFPGEQGPADVYSSGIDSSYCGYDGTGDLFVDGYSGQQIALAELPSGSSGFSELNVGKYFPGPPSQVQWDGSYITYESVNGGEIMISRLQVSGSDVSVVGVTHFRIKKRAYQSWIYHSRIVIPYGSPFNVATRVGVWKYPGGGSPVKSAKVAELRSGGLKAVTVSAK